MTSHSFSFDAFDYDRLEPHLFRTAHPAFDGARVDESVQATDAVETALAALGIVVSSGCDGRSLSG